MTDSVAIFSPGQRVTDEFNALVSNGQLRFFSAGTSDPLVVYSHPDLGDAYSLGSIVDLNAGAYPITAGQHLTLVYTGAETYRVQCRDSDGNTVWDFDHVRGALDTSPFSATQAIPKYGISTSGSDITISASQVGTLYRIDSSGGDRQITLPNAVNAAVGVPIGIQHAGSGNTVTYSTVASQTIAIPGSTPESVSLSGNGETHWIVSDGANWKLVFQVPPATPDQIIEDTTISDAVAAVDITIPAGVTGFRLIGTGLSCSTSANLTFSISDDGGDTFETINGRYFRDNSNSVSGADVSTSAPAVLIGSAAATTDVNFEAEVRLTDLASAKKSISAHGSSVTDNQAINLKAESVACNAINLVRVAFSTGNIDAGRVICQRL